MKKVYCRDCIHRRLINQVDVCYHKKKRAKCAAKNHDNACKDHEA